jgi:hypothetical protein
VLSSTVTGTAWVTGGGGGGISGSGTINYIPKFTGSTSIGDSVMYESSGNIGIGTTTPAKLLDVNGDALINGLTVGRGPGGLSNNTVLGKDALSSNSGGNGNTAIGNSALDGNTTGSLNTAVGVGAGLVLTTGSQNTFIGMYAGANATTSDLSIVIGGYFDTTLNNFNQSETLSVLKEDAGLNNYTGEISGLPHIWAPDTKLIVDSSTGTLISLNYELYSAIFIEYNLEDTNGSARAGSIKAVWDSAASVIKVTEETTADIGSTIGCTIQFNLGGGFLNVELVNTNGYTVYCNTTSRILIRPTIQTL